MRQFIKSALGIFIALVLVLGVAGCSHAKKSHDLRPAKVVQTATLSTGEQQWAAIKEVMKDNALTVYQYDSEAVSSGRVTSINDFDHWNYASYYEIQAVKKAIEQGIWDSFRVKVDCEDTMIHLYIALLKLGYPADQLSFNYYLVPPSQMSGVITDLGGHAVLIAEIEGKVPYSLEDISIPREAIMIEQELGYYNVGFLTMDHAITEPWNYTDKQGFTKLNERSISVDQAKRYPHYQNRTKYLNTIFKRGK